MFVGLSVALPILVALNRVYRGMHHLTDVIASCVLGAIWLVVLMRLLLSEHPIHSGPMTLHREGPPDDDDEEEEEDGLPMASVAATKLAP